MAPYLLTSRTSEQNPDPRLVASRNAVLCPRAFSALCLSLVRTPVFGFRAHPNPGCSHLRIPAKNPFLNKVPPTGPGAQDVTPSFAGSRGTVQGRLGFPPSPSEQGILQTREGLGQRTRRMDNVRCRAPVCISRGEVTAPTWHASARGQRCLCPAPTAPLGSSPTARRLCQRRAEGAVKEFSKLLQKTGLTSAWVAASVWPGRRWSRRPLFCLRAACGRRTVEDAAGMPVSLARPSPDLSAGGRRLSAAPSGTAQKSCQRTQLTRAGATLPAPSSGSTPSSESLVS